ncbi:unnamed protein product (macronuclear) [Paramecium tetraurelia]|uniref:FHA domain-containing protein n=1 Tax=Paramecium tetraurelia TaxID=5888 RepID=A0CM20_PARTE|nr:uncharacterized protein GSPATT00008316001 [Paramecium tetraurelia]CAK71837.1 unnamed protein product [Paramecium tetraurelia]|eukprot:XP_001439234.1 hypothetical protein (macronuclear) [Paramecium tetraurelia strain d4-2]
MSSTLNFSQLQNNLLNHQHFTQAFSTSQLQLNSSSQVIQSTIIQNQNEMIVENDSQNRDHSLNVYPQAQQTTKPYFDKESPHLMISVYKQHQQSNQKTYILQDDKIIGENQIHKNEIQIIRRKKTSRSDDNNLDFGLASADPNNDYIPCKISTEFGFKYSSRITPQILVFLSLKQLNSKFAEMSQNVFKLIHQFIKEKPKFYIQDYGTSLKTLVRIHKDDPQIMNENNQYLIGADFYFHVVQLSANPQIQSKKQQETDTEYFFQTLVREHIKDRARIHGLTKEESEIFQSKQFQTNLLECLQNYVSTKKQGRKQYNLTNCNRPFLKIQFDTPIIKQMAIFIARPGEQQIFKIGRSQDCDIIVNMNTISRKQTQIKFNRNQWEICDGEGTKQSANGTWQSLQQFENPLNSIQQKTPQPLKIEDKMEIKISDIIFRFDMAKFGIQKRLKLNNHLYKELTRIDDF